MRKIKRKMIKRKKKMIIVSALTLLLCLTTIYAAFSTNLNLSAKGNIVILKDLYVASYGSDSAGNGTRSKPYQTIQKAYDTAGNNASIHILDNIIQKDTINFDKNKKIVLDSINNNSIIRDSSLTNNLLNITTGTTTFKNITFDGGNVEASTALIAVYDSDILIEDGGIFKNNYNSNDFGGAIYLRNSTLTMNGGEFYNNTVSAGGAAIFVHHGATLIMNNGKIHDNDAEDGAIWSRGEIVINNGEIYNNISSSMGGGITSNGKLTIYNCKIHNNKARIGGGIALGYYTGKESILYMNGGNIYSNAATQKGGGIYVSVNTNYVQSGGIIENNTPDNVYNAN